MMIQRTDPRFWDLRVVERRVRRGELSRADLEAHLATLADAGERSMPSIPSDEPEPRVRERRPMVKVTLPPATSRLGSTDKSRLDDLDDEDYLDDLDDEDEDEDEDE